jgi:diguanylate cyclase
MCSPCSISIGFKQVNDRFSHVVGDAVLRSVAALLLSCVGSAGYAARFGGEEFVLVLPDTELVVAVPMMEAICQALRDADWSAIAPGLSATCSMGIASTREAGEFSEIMLLADNRLYAAKADGRDRIVWCDPEVLMAGQ